MGTLRYSNLQTPAKKSFAVFKTPMTQEVNFFQKYYGRGIIATAIQRKFEEQRPSILTLLFYCDREDFRIACNLLIQKKSGVNNSTL